MILIYGQTYYNALWYIFINSYIVKTTIFRGRDLSSYTIYCEDNAFYVTMIENGADFNAVVYLLEAD